MENREQNLQTVLAFFAPETRALGGAKRRAALFSQRGVKQICYPIDRKHTGNAPELPAKDLLESQPDINTGLDLDCVIWATEDPCCFRAETIEQGTLTVCGKTGPFRGYSLHTFLVKGGKIESWRVFPNTFTVYPTLNLEAADAGVLLRMAECRHGDAPGDGQGYGGKQPPHHRETSACAGPFGCGAGQRRRRPGAGEGIRDL